METVEKSFTGTYEQKRAAVADMNLTDDTFCSAVLENTKACEYLLSALLRKKIKVIENKTQYSIRNIENRSVVLDVFVEDDKHRFYNVEVDTGDGKFHERRLRYHGASIDLSHMRKGTKNFKTMPDVYLIYISTTDIFGLKRNHYRVEQRIAKSRIRYNDGLHKLYFNTEVKSRTKLSKLLQYLKNSDPYNRNFGALSDAVAYYKINNEGVDYMCKIVDDYAATRERKGRIEGEIKGKVKTVKNLINDGFDLEKALKYANLDLQTYEKYTADRV